MPSIFKIFGEAQFRGDATGSGNALNIADSSGTARLTVANTGRLTLGQDTGSTIQTAAVITTSAANGFLILQPNGSGGISTAIPDNSSTGGNARGSHSVDLQTQRSSATQVASVTNSVLIGGRGNTANGVSAAVIAGGSSGGVGNTATGDSSVCVGGIRNQTLADFSVALAGHAARGNLFGQIVSSNGFMGTAAGDNQFSILKFFRAITGQTIQELYLDGASILAVLTLSAPSGVQNARAWRAQINFVAICSTVGNGTGNLDDCFMGSYLVAIKRVLNTTSLVGTVAILNEVSDASMSTSLVTITADDTNEALKIQFTPPSATAGTTSVYKTVATAFLTEVGR